MAATFQIYGYRNLIESTPFEGLRTLEDAAAGAHSPIRIYEWKTDAASFAKSVSVLEATSSRFEEDVDFFTYRERLCLATADTQSAMKAIGLLRAGGIFTAPPPPPLTISVGEPETAASEPIPARPERLAAPPPLPPTKAPASSVRVWLLWGIVAIALIWIFKPSSSGPDKDAAPKAPTAQRPVAVTPGIVNFSANPAEVSTCAGTTTLSWKVSGANTILLDGKAVAAEGSLDEAEIHGPLHFTLTASNGAGTVPVTKGVDVKYTWMQQEWVAWRQEFGALIGEARLKKKMADCLASCTRPEHCL